MDWCWKKSPALIEMIPPQPQLPSSAAFYPSEGYVSLGIAQPNG